MSSNFSFDWGSCSTIIRNCPKVSQKDGGEDYLVQVLRSNRSSGRCKLVARVSPRDPNTAILIAVGRHKLVEHVFPTGPKTVQFYAIEII